MDSFDILSVETKVETLEDVEEKRDVYYDSLFNWTDTYSENFGSQESESVNAVSARSQIVLLWVSFANMEANLGHFKQCSKVFKEAVSDAVVGGEIELYRQFSTLLQRSKPGNFKFDINITNYDDDDEEESGSNSGNGNIGNVFPVYRHGITNRNMSSENVEEVWNLCLQTYNSDINGSPDRDMEGKMGESMGVGMHALYHMIQDKITEMQKLAGEGQSGDDVLMLRVPSAVGVREVVVDGTSQTSTATQMKTEAETIIQIKLEGDEQEQKEEEEEEEKEGSTAKVSKPYSIGTGLAIKQEPVVEASSSSSAPTSSSLSLSKNVLPLSLPELEDVSGLTPELVIKRYHLRPPMLFEPLATEETMKKVLPPMRPEDIAALEKYLGITFTIASTTTTTDTGTGTGNINDNAIHTHIQSHCKWILDLLEAMYITQAIKERDYHRWYEELNTMHSVECIRSKEKHREKEREKNASATASGVHLVSDGLSMSSSMQDLTKHSQKLDAKLSVQRELLTALINKSLLNLLCEQHKILIALSFPGFTLSIWEKLETYLTNHKIGAPVPPLDITLKGQLTRQQQYIGTLLYKSGVLQKHTVHADEIANVYVANRSGSGNKTSRFTVRSPDGFPGTGTGIGIGIVNSNRVSFHPTPQPPSTSAATVTAVALPKSSLKRKLDAPVLAIQSLPVVGSSTTTPIPPPMPPKRAKVTGKVEPAVQVQADLEVGAVVATPDTDEDMDKDTNKSAKFRVSQAKTIDISEVKIAVAPLTATTAKKRGGAKVKVAGTKAVKAGAAAASAVTKAKAKVNKEVPVQATAARRSTRGK